MNYEIEDDIAPPVSKAKAERLTKQQKAFKAYADAYQRCYFMRPTLKNVTKAGFFESDTLQHSVDIRRLKELTGMLKERAKDL